MIRFDDLTREERYYSATILPYLFAFNRFEGLKIFEEYLMKNYSDKIEIESDVSQIQLLSEIFLDRDLPYYKIPIPPTAFQHKSSKQSKPDLLILTSKSLYLFECKVFTNSSEYDLHSQIMNQKYVLDIVESVSELKFSTKIHFLVLPYRYDILDCFVITWDELFKLFGTLISKDDYFFQRLKKMIQRL